MTTKPVFSAPMSPARVHGSPHVEELALPKSLKSCNFTLAKAAIRWISVKIVYKRHFGHSEGAPFGQTMIFVLVALAALAAGFINAVAGGGSFLTFPALIAAGLPPTAGAGIMAVPDAVLLFAVRRAHARIHIEHDTSRRTTTRYASKPASEGITDPRNWSIRRRLKSSLRTPAFDSPAGFAMTASFDPE
jgi:hypothetical protein